MEPNVTNHHFSTSKLKRPIFVEVHCKILIGNILRNEHDLFQYWQKISETVRQFCLINFIILVQRQVTWWAAGGGGGGAGVPNYPNYFLHQSSICHRAGDVSWSASAVLFEMVWGAVTSHQSAGSSTDIPVVSVWRMIFTVFAVAAAGYKNSLTHSCLVYIYLQGTNFRLSRLSPLLSLPGGLNSLH